jgi:hypothetical protein
MAKKQPMYGSEASVDNDAIADYAITWTANEPTAGDATTIADGDEVGDNNDAGQAIADLTAKLNAVLAALRKFGIIAT